MTTNSKWASSWWAFHEDEEGLESLQVIMILAIAAVCLITVKNFWPRIRDWFSSQTKEATKDGWDTGKP